jgi:hypothetical protein
MLRFFGSRRAAAALLLLAAGTGRTAPVEPEPPARLDQVPATAALVVHLRGLQGGRDRLVALLKKALPDHAAVVEKQLDGWLKDGVEGRKFRGLAKDGPIFLVFFELRDVGRDPPRFAVIARVTNYNEARDNFLKPDERKGLKKGKSGVESLEPGHGPGLYFVNRRGYVIATLSEDIAVSFTKKQPALDTKLSPELVARFLKSDVGLFMNMDVVNKKYADQIQEARKAVESALKEAPGTATGKAAKQLIGLVEKGVGPAFRAVEDSRGVLLTAELRPSGLALHAEAELRKGSPTARALAGFKPALAGEVGTLPAGQMFYTGTQTGPELLKALAPLVLGASRDPESKAGKAVASALEGVARAGPGMRADCFNVPLGGLQVWKFKDPAGAVDAQLKLLKALAAGDTFRTGVVKGRPAVKPKAQKYGKMTFHEVRVPWDVEKMAEQFAGGAGLPDEVKKQIAEGLKKLLGTEVRYWLGHDARAVYQVTGKDWLAAKALLDQYFTETKLIAALPAYREVRKGLPPEVTLLAVVDVVRYAYTLAEFAKPFAGAMMPLPPGYPPAPGKGDEPAFVGLSGTVRPQGGGFDLYVPAGTVKRFYDTFVKPLLK